MDGGAGLISRFPVRGSICLADFTISRDHCENKTILITSSCTEKEEE